MITTRAYTSHDRAACHGVFYDAVHVGAAHAYSPAQRQAWAPSATLDATQPDRLASQLTWVAEETDTLVGFLSLRLDGYLDMMFVLSRMHRRGVAATLYARAMAKAQELNVTRLWVDASKLAQPFFAKLGWHTAYHEYHLTRGHRLSRFRMTLSLKEGTA